MLWSFSEKKADKWSQNQKEEPINGGVNYPKIAFMHDTCRWNGFASFKQIVLHNLRRRNFLTYELMSLLTPYEFFSAVCVFFF